MHFDEKAKTWDDDTDKIERAKVFANEIKQFIQPTHTHLKAMEFGCGTGLLSFELKDFFSEITLIDTSEGMIQVLKEKIKTHQINNFKPLLKNLLTEEFNQNHFDVIYTAMTLHHINDLTKIFNVFNANLKENGLICIADLVEEDGSFHPKEMNFDGHFGFNKNELYNILIENNFKPLHYAICYEIKKISNGKSKKYPLFLLIAQKIN